MSLVTLFQLPAAEKLNEFLAILVLTFGRIKLCFGPFVFLVLLRLLRCNIEFCSLQIGTHLLHGQVHECGSETHRHHMLNVTYCLHFVAHHIARCWTNYELDDVEESSMSIVHHFQHFSLPQLWTTLWHSFSYMVQHILLDTWLLHWLKLF